MFKTLLFFLLGLIFFQAAEAQKDSILVRMNNNGKVLGSKDSADYLMLIMTPPDSSTGIKINTVKQFYTNYTPKLVGKAIIHLNGVMLDLKFVGPCVTYYPNGSRKEIMNYNDGELWGNYTQYYPNGKIYRLLKYNGNKIEKLVECSDSTDNKITENGNGKWMEWDDEFKNIVVHGAVKDSLKEGEWQGMDGAKIICVTLYKKGNFISGIRYDRSGKPHTYTKFEVEPTYKNSPADFSAYLASTIKYPDSDRANGTQGKVIVTFVVERDGSLSNVKALQGPSQSTMDEVVHVIQQAPAWLPGVQNGRPVRVQYTISFAFSLGTSNY